MQTSNVSIAKKTNFSTRKMTTLALLIAIGVVAIALVEIPIFPPAPFLKYDPGDIPILIGTLIYGPVAGLIITFVVSFIQSFMLKGSSGIIGFFMHVVATGAMVIVAGNVYKFLGDTKKYSQQIALFMGAIAMVVFMVGMNLIVTPRFMNVPFEKVKEMIVPIIIPFNIIKAGLNSIITFIVYKYVKNIIKI